MTISSMKSKFKGVIFDLDGTLVDSLSDIALSMNYILEQDVLPVHTLETYKVFVGNGMKKLVSRSLPKEYLSNTDSYLERLLEYYGSHCTEETKPYLGIVDLLTELQASNIKISVCTNKKHDFVQPILDYCFPDIQFSFVVGDQFDGKHKPDPFYPLKCVNEMGLNIDEVLFIGDSNVDIQTANNASMKSVGVTWGFRSSQELTDEGATWVVTDPQEIFDIVMAA